MQCRKPLLFSLPFLFLLAACQPAPLETPRIVAVSGHGELSVAPEVAIVRLAVEARAKEVGPAQAEAGNVTERVLALADEVGIPGERVQSTEIRVQPEFDWNEGRQQMRGYLVHREVRIELENLETLGPLMERALAAGVNRVTPPELRVKNPRELHRRVLALAAEDARANAEALATTLDVSLGKVHSLRATGGNRPLPPQEMAFRQSADSGAEESYETGRITVSASVNAEFELN